MVDPGEHLRAPMRLDQHQQHPGHPSKHPIDEFTEDPPNLDLLSRSLEKVKHLQQRHRKLLGAP